MQFKIEGTEIAITAPAWTVLMAQVEDRLARGDGFSLATLNLDHLVKLRVAPGFREAYAAQDIVVADGNPIVWLSRIAGQRVELMPGSELVVPLSRAAARLGRPIALLGATEATLEGAAEALVRAVPGLEVGLRIAPPMGYDPEGAAALADLTRIHESRAGLCFLALGAPKQERLAARGVQVAPGTGFVSVGAGLDFLAGTQVRAPAVLRRLSLEWAWRMLRDPRRMAGRYLSCAAILPSEIAAARRLRAGSQ